MKNNALDARCRGVVSTTLGEPTRAAAAPAGRQSGAGNMPILAHRLRQTWRLSSPASTSFAGLPSGASSLHFSPGVPLNNDIYRNLQAPSKASKPRPVAATCCRPSPALLHRETYPCRERRRLDQTAARAHHDA